MKTKLPKVGMWKGYPFSIKGIEKGYLFCQNGILKGKGLHHRTEPPRINFVKYPPGDIGRSRVSRSFNLLVNSSFYSGFAWSVFDFYFSDALFSPCTIFFYRDQLNYLIHDVLPDENEGHFPFCSLKFPTSPLCANGVARACLAYIGGLHRK